MFISLALIILIGFTLSGLLNRLKLPGLLGMMLTGMLLGPYVLNWMDQSLLNLAPDLRKMALIVILIRAGLSLDLKDLKQVGRPAVFMCFVPATFEMLAITLLAPMLLPITYLEAAIMGAVLAAVSPAVIVPRMIHMIEHQVGVKKSIPQLVLAGASVDDLYVIMIFAALIGMYQGDGFHISALIGVPIAMVLGLFMGIVSGLVLTKVFQFIHMRDTVKVLLLISVAFLLVTLEDVLAATIPISGLLAVMALAGTLLKSYETLALRLKHKFSKVWVAAELMLFVLVGAALDFSYLSMAGFGAVLLILLALCIRTLSVFLSLLKTELTLKERLFVAIAYLPKATVQAAIGAIPLSIGVAAGPVILAVAVLAILITAPLGALGIDLSQKYLIGS